MLSKNSWPHFYFVLLFFHHKFMSTSIRSLTFFLAFEYHHHYLDYIWMYIIYAFFVHSLFSINRYGPINSSTAAASAAFFMLYARYDAVGHFFRWKCWNKKKQKNRRTTTQCDVMCMPIHRVVGVNHKYQNLFTWNHFFCMKHSPIYILPSLNFVLCVYIHYARLYVKWFFYCIWVCVRVSLLWVRENSVASAGTVQAYLRTMAMIDCWVCVCECIPWMRWKCWMK